jgi:hypothetical protein
MVPHPQESLPNAFSLCTVSDLLLQQAELVKKAVVAPSDSVERPLSPRVAVTANQHPQKVAASEQSSRSIFEQPTLRRSAKDFDMLKVCF